MFTFRRFTNKDIEALVALIAEAEAADEGVSRPMDEIWADLNAAGSDLLRTGWLAQIDGGQIVGYNYMEGTGGATFDFWLRGVVHPAWRGRGIGRELIQAARTAQREACVQRSEPAWINAWAYQQDNRRCRLLARLGLRPEHVYTEMEIAAERVGPVSPLPPGMIIRPWEQGYCEAAVALRNRAFARNWGYQPTTAEALHRRFQSERYESSFSFTAWRQAPGAGEQIVGLVHGCLGWTRKVRQANEAEIVWLAVAEEVRGQGLGQALMLTVMNALREAGAEIISLGTDNYADQPGIALYLKLGFSTRKAIVDYRGEL